jgi:hypothetical protein
LIKLERILIIVLSCSITSLSLFAFYMDISVYASSPQPPFTESQESIMISSSIETANKHIDEAIKAVQHDNSTQALSLLSQLHTDISNINSNVTNLIFSVSAQPP